MPGERSQFIGQGKGYQKIVNRQQFLTLSFQPAGGVIMLAAMATSMAAGLIAHLLAIAVRTVKEYFAVALGATGEYGIQGFYLAPGDTGGVFFPIARLVSFNNFDEVHNQTSPSSVMDRRLTMVLIISVVCKWRLLSVTHGPTLFEWHADVTLLPPDGHRNSDVNYEW